MPRAPFHQNYHLLVLAAAVVNITVCQMLLSKPGELYCNQDLTLMAIMIIKPSQLTILYFYKLILRNTKPRVKTLHVRQWPQ